MQGGKRCALFHESKASIMTTFDKREDAFEKRFAHDEELKFKDGARRNKMLGMWAAEKMGLSGAQAEAYAKEVVVADFEEVGDDFVRGAKINAVIDGDDIIPLQHEIDAPLVWGHLAKLVGKLGRWLRAALPWRSNGMRSELRAKTMRRRGPRRRSSGCAR